MTLDVSCPDFVSCWRSKQTSARRQLWSCDGDDDAERALRPRALLHVVPLIESSVAPPSIRDMTKDCRPKRYGAQRHDHRLRLPTHKCSIADTAHLPFAQPSVQQPFSRSSCTPHSLMDASTTDLTRLKAAPATCLSRSHGFVTIARDDELVVIRMHSAVQWHRQSDGSLVEPGAFCLPAAIYARFVDDIATHMEGLSADH